MRPGARSALVALACFALAGCGGGPGAVHPDLVVEHPTVSDDRPAAAASFTLSATVRNAGDGSAAKTTVRVYRSDDETITPSDKQVGADAVAELAASASGAASAEVTAPSSPGTYYYGACVDAVAGESDTANNCSVARRVTVPEVQDTVPASPQPTQPTRPDLVVESPSVSEHRPPAGTSFRFSATVRNAGAGISAATTLRVYRSDDATVTPFDQEVDTAPVPELAAMESTVASVELSAPSSSGTYYYGACVRAVAEESDSANNCTVTITVTVRGPQVTVRGPPPPDLILVGPRVDNANPAIGGVFELSAVVRNRGPTTAIETTLRFYRSTDATIERSDTHLAARGMWLGTNRYNQKGVYVDMYVKAPSSSAVHYYGACVDAVPGESDTTNNCSAAVMVTFSHNKPDLWVGSWGVWIPRPVGTLRIGKSVYNRGGPSEATTLRLLLLPDRNSPPSAGTQVAEVDVPALVVTQARPASSMRYLEFQTPATPGWYHYVLCVDAVAGESNTANNCSSATAIEFL